MIEIQDRQRLLVHQDVATSVDAVLRGKPMDVEFRYRDEEGDIHIESDEAVVETTALSGRRASRETGRRVVGNRRRRESTATNGNKRRQTTLIGENSTGATKSVFSYGVARNRLRQAAKKLGVNIEIVDDVSDADVLITLKNYYRRRRRVISDAEHRRIPIYVLRANTVSQMENALVEVFDLKAAPDDDPFEEAVAQAERAIERIRAGETSVDLPPAGSSIRRYQHQMARQANLVSHSYGNEPNRHVRIFSTRRNSAPQ